MKQSNVSSKKDDEIEENIEMESKASINNSPNVNRK